MNATQLMEILMTFKPDAKVIIAVNDGSAEGSFHELREVGTDDPSEAVLWPDPAPLVDDDDDEMPPGTLPH